MVSSSWFKGIAPLVTGALALYWQPGLVGVQNSIITASVISGRVVVLIEVFMAFSRAFIGALVGCVASSVVLFHADINAMPKNDRVESHYEFWFARKDYRPETGPSSMGP